MAAGVVRTFAFFLAGTALDRLVGSPVFLPTISAPAEPAHWQMPYDIVLCCNASGNLIA